VAEDANSPIDRGRYLVAVGGCNDCHTPGFAESNGNVPEVDQLLGSDIGYSGPWGVSYAGNLRLAAAMMSPEQWRARAKGGGLPPHALAIPQGHDRRGSGRGARLPAAPGPRRGELPRAPAPGGGHRHPPFRLRAAGPRQGRQALRSRPTAARPRA